jgi:hypothetical protein
METQQIGMLLMAQVWGGFSGKEIINELPTLIYF